MRRFLGAVLAALCFTSSFAYAGTRVIVMPGENPRSQDTNGQARFERLDKGTWRRDALGAACTGGAYSNLSVVPNGGMYIAVQPTASNSLGSIYQMTVDDTNPVPAGGTWSSFLAADNTQICVHGMQSGPSASIGPITAPGGGTSQYFLVEAQLQQQDGANQSVMFVNSQNTQSFQNVNTQRTDVIVYQLKAGTPGVSPTAPSADTGWIGVSNILVPGGVSSITSGMISPLPAFQGFIAQGASVTLQGLTISSLTTAGCLQNTGTGAVISASCTSGLGSVVANSPLTATTSAGVATISCTTCVTSVNGSGNVSSTGGSAPTLSITGTIPYANLPATVAQTGVNNNFSVTQNFQAIVATSLSLSSPLSIANGGTGSATQNFVDLSNTQTVGGNKTLSGSITFNNAPSSANGYTSGSSSYASTLATVNGSFKSTVGYGGYGLYFSSGASSGFTGLAASASTSLQGVTASEFAVCNYQTSCQFTMDTSGNIGILGNVTANSYFTGSRLEWKKNVAPYSFNSLDLLGRVDFKEYDCKDPRCGLAGEHKVGIIANDSPEQVAGKNHDHYDAFAMAAIDGKAIIELKAQVDSLEQALRILIGVVILVAGGLLILAGHRRA